MAKAEQLTIGDILAVITDLEKSGLSIKEISGIPVYLGDDDELNGIHCRWYADLVDPSDDESKRYVELINESRNNIPIKGKALLLS